LCKNGYKGDGHTCIDINECLEPGSTSKPCSPHANCENKQPGFCCTCKEGYLGDGYVCEAVDHCTKAVPEFGVCAHDAKCTPLYPGIKCTCNPGYEGDGFFCTDIDECAADTFEGNRRCSSNAKCTNTKGSFECVCNHGFIGDGYCCQDVNECVDSKDSLGLFWKSCSDFATCVNLRPGYSCLCNPGYRGDGHSCTDINECEENPNACPLKGAVCTNNEGSFSCACPVGSHDDGVSCNPGEAPVPVPVPVPVPAPVTPEPPPTPTPTPQPPLPVPQPPPEGKCITCKEQVCSTEPRWWNYNQAWFCENPDTKLYETVVNPWDCALTKPPPSGCYTDFGICVNEPAAHQGLWYCKYDLSTKNWFPVLTEKNGCQLSYYAEKKRQTTPTVTVAGPNDQPKIDPSDPAAAYLSAGECDDSASVSADTNQDSLSTGAWVAIVFAIVVIGVVLVLGVILTYVYNNNKMKVRFESV